MALFKEITIKGATLNYWKVTGIKWDDRDNVTKATITPYVSEAYRLHDPNNRVTEFSREFLFDGYKTIPEVYALIKGFQDWSTAVDLLSVEQQAVIEDYLLAVAAINIDTDPDPEPVVEEMSENTDPQEVTP